MKELTRLYTRLGEPPQMLFPIRGIHNVRRLFAKVEALFVERAEHSMLLVDSFVGGDGQFPPQRQLWPSAFSAF